MANIHAPNQPLNVANNAAPLLRVHYYGDTNRRRNALLPYVRRDGRRYLAPQVLMRGHYNLAVVNTLVQIATGDEDPIRFVLFTRRGQYMANNEALGAHFGAVAWRGDLLVVRRGSRKGEEYVSIVGKRHHDDAALAVNLWLHWQRDHPGSSPHQLHFTEGGVNLPFAFQGQPYAIGGGQFHVAHEQFTPPGQQHAANAIPDEDGDEDNASGGTAVTEIVSDDDESEGDRDVPIHYVDVNSTTDEDDARDAAPARRSARIRDRSSAGDSPPPQHTLLSPTRRLHPQAENLRPSTTLRYPVLTAPVQPPCLRQRNATPGPSVLPTPQTNPRVRRRQDASPYPTSTLVRRQSSRLNSIKASESA